MNYSIGKLKELYISAISLVLPVVFQLSFISLTLYIYYGGFKRVSVDSGLGWVLLCLVLLSNDILFYCIQRIDAEGYSLGGASEGRMISFRFKLVFFLVLYLLPLGYLLMVSSIEFMFWLTLLSCTGRLAVYYVVREAEKSKIETTVWGILKEGAWHEK